MKKKTNVYYPIWTKLCARDQWTSCVPSTWLRLMSTEQCFFFVFFYCFCIFQSCHAWPIFPDAQWPQAASSGSPSNVSSLRQQPQRESVWSDRMTHRPTFHPSSIKGTRRNLRTQALERIRPGVESHLVMNNSNCNDFWMKKKMARAFSNWMD